MKRHEPDPDRLAAGLARRLDAVESRLIILDQLREDVAALARGQAGLSAQIRALSEATRARIVRSAGSSQPVTSNDEGDGQRDWLAVTDPDTATEWLAELDEFVANVLDPICAGPGIGCWPLHSPVVVELLALLAEHAAAYSGANPTPVSELLGRWLPGARARIRAELTPCINDRGHRTAGRTYDPAGLTTAGVARWWADTHGSDPDAITAFALTLIA